MATAVLRPGDRPLLHLGLLGLTALTTFASFWFWFRGAHWTAEDVRASLTFCVCLLLILGSHEMGHYVLARLHRVDTSLPYFIPFPLGLGTLGAVIRIRARIPNRNALVDIGAAGPLAGLAVALPILVYGVLHSPPTDTVPPSLWPPPASLLSMGHDLLGYLSSRVHGHIRGAGHAEGPGIILFGDNLLTLALKRLLLPPFPPGKDIHEHPAYLAAWAGCLVTMLNLMPIGQLDGGHLTHALFGDRARVIGKVMAIFMLALCLFASAGWIVWLAVTTKVIGFRHPEVIDPAVPLTRGRKWACALCGIGLIICLTPIPLQGLG